LELKLDLSFADAFVVATAENASIAQLKGSKDESQMVYGTVELKSPGSWHVGWGALRKCWKRFCRLIAWRWNFSE